MDTALEGGGGEETAVVLTKTEARLSVVLGLSGCGLTQMVLQQYPYSAVTRTLEEDYILLVLVHRF